MSDLSHTHAFAKLAAAVADRYTIDRELGAGGMATVYLAHDIKHDRDVAIKVLHADLGAALGGERFLSEIRTTARLQHPHILPLLDSGDADGLLYYVMPLVTGETLRSRLERERQLPVDDAVLIAREVADALGYAHGLGVIHRDIKPENILLQGGHALVADFGIALAVQQAGGARMTQTGLSLGTPQYMSPEQAMGEKTIDARSDIYALGAVTYEMLVGEPPFTGPSVQAIVARLVTEEPRPISVQRKAVPEAVEAAVLHALEKLPADRFATAAQFAEALAGHGPAFSTRATASSVAASISGTTWRRRFQLASIIALLAIAFGTWAWIHGRALASRPIERHYITLGDSAKLQTGRRVGLPLAISPDGSRLAFIGDTLFRIWVKNRDAIDAAPLAGTDGATSPTFSPDGRWIAYIAGDLLKKVPVNGGVSITLADSAAPGFGVAWLDDGSLVYTDDPLLGLRRVKESGGPSVVVVADTTFKGQSPMMATPLPHALGVLFAVCTSNCVTVSFHALDFKTGRTTLVADGVGAGWYLPNDRLLYVQPSGVAMMVPFDLSTFAIKGSPIPVLQGVDMSLPFPEVAWSKSGTLVYQRGPNTPGMATLQEAGRDGATTVFDPAWTGNFNSFALSPDGRRVAVSVGTPDGQLDIWIKQLDRGPFTRLTFSGHDRRPTWSPDGREVAFIRDSGSGGGAVWARAADGGGPERRLTHLSRALQEVEWSHDGHWLLVRTESGAAGNGDILAVSAVGDTTVIPIATTAATELQPALSPDGHWVAYVSNEAGSGLNTEVFVRPFPNAAAGRWQVSNGGGGSPVWAADGKELFFLDRSNHLVAAEIGPGPSFNVSRLTPLFDASASAFGYVGYHTAFAVTRDGKFVFLAPVPQVRSSLSQLVQVDNWFADLRAKLKP